MDYDETILSELALKLLEGDIRYCCSLYHIPGYDRNDLEQECRLKLWQNFNKFDASRGIMLRTWASQVMKNHLKNLLRGVSRDLHRVEKSAVYILLEQITEDTHND